MNSQPYQEASDEIKKQNEAPGKFLKNAASFGLSVAGGGAIANRVLPLLNKFVPFELAKKGLSKINPKLGSFIDGALKQGYSVEDAMGFIKNKSGISEEKPSQKSPDQRSIIEQYSPELFQFLKTEIGKGRQPLQAGAVARLNNSFKNIIQKMEEDHKTPFSSILESTFGGAPESQPNQESMQPQQKQSQQNNGDVALLAALDKILKM